MNTLTKWVVEVVRFYMYPEGAMERICYQKRKIKKEAKDNSNILGPNNASAIY